MKFPSDPPPPPRTWLGLHGIDYSEGAEPKREVSTRYVSNALELFGSSFRGVKPLTQSAWARYDIEAAALKHYRIGKFASSVFEIYNSRLVSATVLS